MPRHDRGFIEDDQPIRPGVIIGITAAIAIAVIVAVVFINIQGSKSKQTADSTSGSTLVSDTTNSNSASGSQQPAANASSASNSAAQSTANSASSSATTDAASATSNSETANATATATVNTNANANANAEGGASGDATGGSGESAPLGNAYLNGEQSDSGTGTSSQESGGSATSSSSRTTPTYSSESGWIDGQACATEYATTGSGSASDIAWDDSEAQVGLDLSSYPHAHFGDYVEIEYNGNTVTAQVVDCGRYGAGDTGLILNPGVFEEFGVYDSDEWGRRDVSYRFV